MSSITYRLPYTNRDFASIMDAIKSRIPQDDPQWNDFLQSNYGITILSGFAAITDLLSFYVDRQAAECFIPTALGKTSLVDLFQLINYQIRGMVPAYTTLMVTVDEVQSSDVVIPKYSEFSDSSGTNRFVTVSGGTITAGETRVMIPARQGLWQFETFNSNGSLQQRLILGRTDIAEGFIRVWVGKQEWYPATDNTFVGHSSSDQVFRVIRNAINSAGPQDSTPALAPEIVTTTIEFGDNLEGAVPQTGLPIRVDYLVTKGDSVKVPAGAVNRPVSLFYNTLGDPVSISVSNVTSAAGGDMAESIYAARRRYPAAFRTMRRAVTIYDYQKYAESFDGVLMARAYDLNNNADTNENLTDDRPIPVEKALPFYHIRIYVLPRADFASDALNQALTNFLQARADVGKQIVILNPALINISVSVRIRIYNNYNAEDVKHAVVLAIQDFFTIKRDGEVSIGKSLALSRLVARIQQVQGVAALEMVSPVSDIQVQFDQIIRLAAVTVSLASSV